MNIKEKFLRMIFPPKCVVCGEIIQNGYVCIDCFTNFHLIDEPKCAVCSRPLGSALALPICGECMGGKPYRKLFIPFLYQGSAATAIRNMKFHGRAAVFRYFAAEIFLELGDFRPDFITYVPQDKATARQRGYNQTKLIAKELGALMGVKVIPTLIRVEKGKRQVSLSRSERIKNARRLYVPMNKKLQGKALIIDDVVTTGSTMEQCCRLLGQMGCKDVFGAAAAKVIL